MGIAGVSAWVPFQQWRWKHAWQISGMDILTRASDLKITPQATQAGHFASIVPLP
jgi:hypothetical protein